MTRAIQTDEGGDSDGEEKGRKEEEGHEKEGRKEAVVAWRGAPQRPSFFLTVR